MFVERPSSQCIEEPIDALESGTANIQLRLAVTSSVFWCQS